MTTETIAVTLHAEVLRALRARVAAGEFASEGDALADAVRAWERERKERAAHLETIRARIRRSLDDPRPSLSEEEVDAFLEELHAQALKTHSDEAA
ncbi:MAG: type II toxin-antitoxin system ParD family antitoxin [Xanthobacteraceae bacterium]